MEPASSGWYTGGPPAGEIGPVGPPMSDPTLAITVSMFVHAPQIPDICERRKGPVPDELLTWQQTSRSKVRSPYGRVL